MAKSRQFFSGRNYNPFDGKKFLEKPVSVTRMGQLFEQIKAQEIERKIQREKEEKAAENTNINTDISTKVQESKTEIRNIDENLERELHTSSRRRKFNMSVVKRDDKNKENIEKDVRTKKEKFEDTPVYHILSDDRISSLVNYINVLKAYVDLIENVQDQYSYCSNKLSECEKKRQDFLHEIGQPRKSASEGFKLYDIAHKVEVQRRAYKDSINILQPLVSLANKQRDVVYKIKETIEKLEIGKEARENRLYIPRSDLDLPVGDRFRSLTKTEQEKVIRNYERTHGRVV